MLQFIDNDKEANLENGIAYFAVGLVAEDYRDGATSMGKDFVVEFIDPWGNYCREWRAEEEVTIAPISDDGALLLRAAYDSCH